MPLQYDPDDTIRKYDFTKFKNIIINEFLREEFGDLSKEEIIDCLKKEYPEKFI